MTTYFVSRHVGARQWLARRGVRVDCQIDHLDVADVAPGDTVIGTLPVSLAAEVCTRGARYVHLTLDLPAERRGQELDVDELDSLGAQLRPYLVQLLPLDPEQRQPAPWDPEQPQADDAIPEAAGNHRP